jgi:hypothetical protein
MQAATYSSIGLVIGESIWRLNRCNLVRIADLLASSTFTFLPSSIFLCAYLLTIATIFLHIKPYINNQPFIRNIISFLHAGDSFSAMILGYAIYRENSIILIVGILIITKFFLLHVIARMVTGETSSSMGITALQTTRAFIHHVGSFLFLSDQPLSVIILTVIWRFASMSGHTVVTYREYFDKEIFYEIMKVTSMSRNIAVASILAICLVNPSIRRGFGVSAIGHISYLVVRIGPVFRLGSIYVKDGLEKTSWQKLTDYERMEAVFALKYPLLSLELLVISSAIIFFLFLRATTFAEVTETCAFI